MAPAAKRRKTNNVQRFLCYGCDVERISSQFPDTNPSSKCDHLINTCKTCLKKWIQAQIEGGHFLKDAENSKVFGVACPHPGCKGVMLASDVQESVSNKVFANFEELERRIIAENTPGWRWCLAPGCKAGQVHDSGEALTIIKTEPELQHASKSKKHNTKKAGVGKAETGSEAEVIDKFKCHECGAEACVPCDRPYHDGETCAQYQLRVQDRFDEEDQALKEIQKSTKKCPNCRVNVQKNGGCPYMQCKGHQSQY